jgi:CRP-like cAMP-binding protein
MTVLEEDHQLHLQIFFMKNKRQIVIRPTDLDLFNTRGRNEIEKQKLSEKMIKSVLGYQQAIGEAFLGSVPLLSALPEEVKNAIIPKLEPVYYEPDQWVFYKGDPADGMYLVKQGRLVVVGMSGVISEVTEGGFFGEVALLRGGFRTAGVRCSSEGRCELLRLSTATVRDLFKRYPKMEQAWRLQLSHYALIQERQEIDDHEQQLKKGKAHASALFGDEEESLSKHLMPMLRRESFVKNSGEHTIKHAAGIKTANHSLTDRGIAEGHLLDGKAVQDHFAAALHAALGGDEQAFIY